MSMVEFGALLVDLPGIQTAETRISDLPPFGAGRLLQDDGVNFRWEAIDTPAWNALKPEERAEMVIARGIAWLEHNGSAVGSPIAFIDPAAARDAGEQLFGTAGGSLRSALCAAHKLMHTNPVAAQSAMFMLSATLFYITGLHPVGSLVPSTAAQVVGHLPTATPHVAELLLTAFAQKFCCHS